MSTKKDNDEQVFSVLNNFSNDFDENLKSAILDIFDFDMTWLEKEIKKVDWSVEITNPLDEYDFLKKINRDFLIF
jgi:predicted HTH transcriptional regulator